MIYKTLLSQSKYLEKQITSLRTQIASLPEGKLVCKHDKDHIRWLYRDREHSGYQSIYKSNRELAEQLAKKNYLSLLLEEAMTEKKAIDSYLRHHDKTISGKIQKLLSQPAYKELLASDYQKLLHAANLSQELIDWTLAPYETNPHYSENLSIHTASGTAVRSKSEAFIEMILRKYSIPFRYECKLELGTHTLYPDFTIRHPKTGREYYWEHCGMMETPSYVQTFTTKLKTYCEYNIYPDDQLILTFETKIHPLSPDTVEHIVQTKFLK